MGIECHIILPLTYCIVSHWYYTQLLICAQTLSISSSESAESDDSDYIPTPLRLRQTFRLQMSPCSIPHHCSLVDLKPNEKFVDQLNDTRVCKTAGCQGRLIPRDVLTRGMGGTTTLVYVCDDCLCIQELEASSKNTPLANNDISLADQVVFITAGCTYTTYANALQLLGIKPVNNHAFIKTLETLHPIVEAMVNAMCNRRNNTLTLLPSQP